MHVIGTYGALKETISSDRLSEDSTFFFSWLIMALMTCFGKITVFLPLPSGCGCGGLVILGISRHPFLSFYNEN